MAEQFVERVSRGDRVYVLGKVARRTVEKEDGKKEEKTRIEVSFWQPTMIRSRAAGADPWSQESHGIEGARGPGSRTDMVPFPSASNTAFTPNTMPSSKSQLVGGLPVWVTNVRRLPDGRITFHIGYEYQ